MKLSKITNKLSGQPMFKLLAKAKELELKEHRDIIHFEIGDPNFDSPLPAIKAAIQSLKKGETHYTNSMGLLELRQTVQESIKENYGFTPDLEQILICPANAVIDFTIRCVADPGDEVIMPDPGFPTYSASALYNGIIPVKIPLKECNNFRMDPSDIEKAITSKTRMIIINSPNNPTGSIIGDDEVRAIAELAKKNDIFLLSDEVYSNISYGYHYSPFMYDFCKKRTIMLHSLSKTYAMSGWRIGYVIGPKKLIGKMGALLQTIISCLPVFTQRGASAALTDCEDIVNKRLFILQERRDLLVDGLNNLPGIKCLVPDGAYYVFPNIKRTGMTSQEFSNVMLDAGVCVLPGNCFGKYGNGYVRLSYASTTTDQIKDALERMKGFL